jgi:uncharacterized membrane protein YphA (DoxX/SURF4 family)
MGRGVMADSSAERNLVLVFRLLMAWTFIYAASHQAFTDFSVIGFLKSIPPPRAALFVVRFAKKHVALRLTLRSVDAGRSSGRG